MFGLDRAFPAFHQIKKLLAQRLGFMAHFIVPWRRQSWRFGRVELRWAQESHVISCYK